MANVVLPPEVKLRHHIRVTVEKSLERVKDEQVNLASHAARMNLAKKITDRLIEVLINNDGN